MIGYGMSRCLADLNLTQPVICVSYIILHCGLGWSIGTTAILPSKMNTIPRRRRWEDTREIYPCCMQIGIQDQSAPSRFPVHKDFFCLTITGLLLMIFPTKWRAKGRTKVRLSTKQILLGSLSFQGSCLLANTSVSNILYTFKVDSSASQWSL